jgi:putative sigma-54 modulation protein
MQLIITGKNLQVSDRLKEHIEKKIGRLDRYLPDLTDAQVELSVDHARKDKRRQVVQVTLRTNGTILRGEERAESMRVAIDAVLNKLNRQIIRFKEKRHQKYRLNTEMPPVRLTAAERRIPQIARVKEHRVPAMTEEQASEQMELLGHSFFIFYNAEREGLNVLYRRDDGDFGLIVPVLE